MARSRNEAQKGIQASPAWLYTTEDMRGPQGTKEASRRLFWQPDWGEQEDQ